MTWLRRHALAVGITIWGLASFALFTWAEWGFFCDQAASHKEPCGSFWSAGHIHDWAYNAASNWQSEALVGVTVVLFLSKLEGRHGADRDDLG